MKFHNCENNVCFSKTNPRLMYLEVINPSDIEYVILCAGCSFTSCRKGDEEYPYASFLPGHTYNIGIRGSGIVPTYFRNFLQNVPDINLTHVVYQVPCPTRQPADLNDFKERHFRATLGKSRPRSVWMQLTVGHKPSHPNFSLQAFDKIDQYLKKAIDMVDINVKLIREQNPNVKIIFLRYEHTNRPLIYEFSKRFYKTILTDYCKENNITYIYEENFNTKWFKKNKYGSHPNKAGAKLIADKIKEYL